MPSSVDLYPRSDGPILRIGTYTREELEAVLALLEELAGGTVREIDLLASLRPSTSGVTGVTMACAPKRVNRTLFVTSKGRERVDLRWHGDTEYWLECLEMAQVLLERERPAHQYFNPEYGDVATISLTYLEPPLRL